MRFSVEILDQIFSFLVYERSTLSCCLNDPVLSPIAERYLYYHITVNGDGMTWQDPGSGTLLRLDRLFKFLSENPRVRNHVRVLHIVNGTPSDEGIRTFAEILMLFPNLQSILTNVRGRRWPDVFRASLKGPLNLSNVKEVRLVGDQTGFPFWLLDRCENLTDLLLLGTFEEDDQAPCDSIPARLKSLRLNTSLQSSSLNWVKLRIIQLESLTISSQMDPTTFLPLLGACSATLKKLDINLTGPKDYTLKTRHHSVVPVISPLPTNLEQLTIRITIEFVFNPNHSPDPYLCQSSLPLAAGLIRQFIPYHPRHLVLDIQYPNAVDFSNVDISPLAVLEVASVSIPRIDLYTFAQNPILVREPPEIPITGARLMSALENYPKVVKLINEGKVIVHSQKMAPWAII